VFLYSSFQSAAAKAAAAAVTHRRRPAHPGLGAVGSSGWQLLREVGGEKISVSTKARERFGRAPSSFRESGWPKHSVVVAKSRCCGDRSQAVGTCFRGAVGFLGRRISSSQHGSYRPEDGNHEPLVLVRC